MHYTKEQLAEIDLLIQFNLDSLQQGIKVHTSATESTRLAIESLYEKGLVTQADGGYLTDLGRTAAEHAQALHLILSPHELRNSN